MTQRENCSEMKVVSGIKDLFFVVQLLFMFPTCNASDMGISSNNASKAVRLSGSVDAHELFK